MIWSLLSLLLNGVLLSLCRSMPGWYQSIASNQTSGYCWSSEDWGSSQRRSSGPAPGRSGTGRPGRAGSSRWSCPSPSPGRWPGCAYSATGSAWSSSGPTASPAINSYNFYFYRIFSKHIYILQHNIEACYSTAMIAGIGKKEGKPFRFVV